MITNKDGKEVRLITINQLCSTCLCNSHKIDEQAFPLFICTNKANGCNGYTLNENCPIWKGLTSIFVLNI